MVFNDMRAAHSGGGGRLSSQRLIAGMFLGQDICVNRRSYRNIHKMMEGFNTAVIKYIISISLPRHATIAACLLGPMHVFLSLKYTENERTRRRGSL